MTTECKSGSVWWCEDCRYETMVVYDVVLVPMSVCYCTHWSGHSASQRSVSVQEAVDYFNACGLSVSVLASVLTAGSAGIQLTSL